MEPDNAPPTLVVSNFALKPARAPKTSAKYRKACAEVDRRSGGMCEANIAGTCHPGPHRGHAHHHVLLRARGGDDAASNLLLVCLDAHLFIHANPAQATELGLMRRRSA